jgi:dihydroorotate dehydrogenase
MLIYKLARPALFALDPERAHELTLRSIDALTVCGLLSRLVGAPVADPFSLLGLNFGNRVGLAAGLDKNAAYVDALAALGFGFLELGTVTPLPQNGNPLPRLFRLASARALINRFGFNNVGLERFVANIERAHWPRAANHPIGLNIGKNAVTPIDRAHDDYLTCLRAVHKHADYVTVNVSSPNTKDLRSLQGADALSALLRQLRDEQTRLDRSENRSVPLLLKIAPDLDTEQLEAIAAALTRFGIDGVIATNTTIDRSAVTGVAHGGETGGLSGAPLAQKSNRIIAALRQLLPSRYPIIGVGGIQSAEDAIAKINAGADLVQLYTGLIYARRRLRVAPRPSRARLRQVLGRTPNNRHRLWMRSCRGPTARSHRTEPYRATVALRHGAMHCCRQTRGSRVHAR